MHLMDVKFGAPKLTKGGHNNENVMVTRNFEITRSGVPRLQSLLFLHASPRQSRDRCLTIKRAPLWPHLQRMRPATAPSVNFFPTFL